MKTIGKFLASRRQRFLARRVQREIYQQILPHLNGTADCGYPFSSHDELVRSHIRDNLRLGLNLRLLGRVGAKLPKAYGNAFRYIAYRDLNERMEMYIRFAEENASPETCDPQFVATRLEPLPQA